MISSDNLTLLSDADLSRAVAVEYLGCEAAKHLPFATDANLLLPFLSAVSPDWSMRVVHGQPEISLYFTGPSREETICAHDVTIPRAACVALVRHARMVKDKVS
jgi:hypothetical protein